MQKLDLQTLREMLARRQKEKAELELQVGSFESHIRNELRPLQEEVLRIQMERLKKAAQTKMRSARLRNAYHDAREEYEQFQEYDEQARRATGDTDLKSTFRRGSKACHPDAVPDAYRDEAAATFRALESAYEGKHRRAVEAITESLETWGFPGSGLERGRKAPERARIQEALVSLDDSISSLRESDSFEIIQGTENVEAAVDAEKRRLARRLREIQRSRKGRSRRRWG